MPKWNLVAMGQAGLTGWTRVAAQSVARAFARSTGRPEPQMLSLIGAGFLAIALIDFLRQVDAVIAAGRPRRQPANDAPAAYAQDWPAGSGRARRVPGRAVRHGHSWSSMRPAAEWRQGLGIVVLCPLCSCLPSPRVATVRTASLAWCLQAAMLACPVIFKIPMVR